MGAVARRVASAAERRVLSSGRFEISESRLGELVITWQRDGTGQPDEFRLPRTLTVLVRKAAAGEQISPAALVRAMGGRGG